MGMLNKALTVKCIHSKVPYIHVLQQLVDLYYAFERGKLLTN